MTVREVLLALALSAGLAAVVNGVAMLSAAAAWIVAGLGAAALGVFFLAEVD